MRKIILASAVMALSAGTAMAGGSANVTINSSVAAACSISDATTTILLGTAAGASQPGLFKTTCNFSVANFSVNFKSVNGGVKNNIENVTKDYKLTYNSTDYLAGTQLTGAGQTVTAAAGGAAGTAATRNFTVALVDALTVAGDYSDTLTITVSP